MSVWSCRAESEDGQGPGGVTGVVGAGCCDDQKLMAEGLMVLLGPNSDGKTSVLDAEELITRAEIPARLFSAEGRDKGGRTYEQRRQVQAAGHGPVARSAE